MMRCTPFGYAMCGLVAILVAAAVPAQAGPDRAYLGVALLPAEKGGAVITHVDPGSPADLLGLKIGYVILGIGPDVINSPKDARRAIADMPVGAWENIYYSVGSTLHSQLVTVWDREAYDRGEPYSLPPRGMLGFGISNAKGIMGVRVNSVVKGGVAQRAGIEVGDIIIGIEGRKVQEADDVMRLIADRANRPTEVALARRGQLIVGVVTPAAVSQQGALEHKPGEAVTAKSDSGPAQEDGFWCARSPIHAALCVGAGLAIAAALKGSKPSDDHKSDDEWRDDVSKKDRSGGKPMGEDPIDGSQRLRKALE